MGRQRNGMTTGFVDAGAAPLDFDLAFHRQPDFHGRMAESPIEKILTGPHLP